MDVQTVHTRHSSDLPYKASTCMSHYDHHDLQLKQSHSQISSWSVKGGSGNEKLLINLQVHVHVTLGLVGGVCELGDC